MKTGYELTMAKGTAISTYGLMSLTLNLGLRRAFTWNFVIADFLFYFDHLVDISNGCLLDRMTSLSVARKTSKCVTVTGIETITGSSRYHALFQKFPAITRPEGAYNTENRKRTTVHHIHTTPKQPVALKLRQLPLDRLNAVKREFESMLR